MLYLSEQEKHLYPFLFSKQSRSRKRTEVGDTSYRSYYLMKYLNERKRRKKYLLHHTLAWKYSRNFHI